MKLNEPERLKLEGRTCWRWMKHAKLHSDLFQAQQRECLNVLDSQPRTFISASTVLQTERERQRQRERKNEREREKKKKKKKQLIFISVFFCKGTYTRKTSWQISFPSINFLAIYPIWQQSSMQWHKLLAYHLGLPRSNLDPLRPWPQEKYPWRESSGWWNASSLVDCDKQTGEKSKT